MLPAIVLFWRKDDIYSEEIKDILVGLHTWELAHKYIGITMVVAVIALAVSGIWMNVRAKSDENR